MTDTRNSEQMFVRNYHTSIGASNRMGLWHGPNGYHNWAGTTPTQDLVMAFEFEDGSMPVGMTKPGEFQKGNPYNGREPRFMLPWLPMGIHGDGPAQQMRLHWIPLHWGAYRLENMKLPTETWRLNTAMV